MGGAEEPKPALKTVTTMPPPPPMIGAEDVMPAITSAATSYLVCYGLGLPSYDSGVAAATSSCCVAAGDGFSKIAKTGLLVGLGLGAGINTGVMMYMGADTTETLSIVAASTAAAAAARYLVAHAQQSAAVAVVAR